MLHSLHRLWLRNIQNQWSAVELKMYIARMVPQRVFLFSSLMAPKTPRVTRNPELIRGVQKYSSSQMYHKRGHWAIKAKKGGKFPTHEKKSVAAEPTAEKPSNFYPADDVKKPLSNKRKHKPTNLRASISPGTLLIILTGRFKGKHVVFLKQLTSGLLLVTG